MFVAKDSFCGELLGRSFTIRKGQLISDDHPILREFRSKFKRVTSDIEPWDVEEMTANPGVPRAVAPTIPSGDGLEEKSLSNLQFIAAQKRLVTGGSKADLVARIRKYRQEHPGEE